MNEACLACRANDICQGLRFSSQLRDYLVVWGFDLWPTSVGTLFRNLEVPQKHAETTKNKDTVSCDKTIWNNLGTEEQPTAMEPFQVFRMRGLGYVMLMLC